MDSRIVPNLPIPRLGQKTNVRSKGTVVQFFTGGFAPHDDSLFGDKDVTLTGLDLTQGIPAGEMTVRIKAHARRHGCTRLPILLLNLNRPTAYREIPIIIRALTAVSELGSSRERQRAGSRIPPRPTNSSPSQPNWMVLQDRHRPPNRRSFAHRRADWKR